MFKKGLIASFVICSIIAYSDFTNNNAFTNFNAAPSGHSGGPIEGGLTCARSNCHSGGATNPDFNVSLTSDIPVEGFIPGQSYLLNLTASSSGTSFLRGGFQISAQANGVQQGTFIANASESQVSNGYLGHRPSGTVISGNTRTWNIQWTAPSNFIDSLRFYAVVNFTNNNTNALGDVVKSISLLANAQQTSIQELNNSPFSVFPNPSSNTVFVSSNSNIEEKFEVLNFSGQLVAKGVILNGKAELPVKGFISGIYFLKIGSKAIKFIVS